MWLWPTPDATNCGQDVTADIRIVMQPGADVFGTVRDTAGAPVAGVAVYSNIDVLFMNAPRAPSFGSVTDNQGRYRIYGDQQGETVAIALSLDPQREISFNGTAGSDTPVDITDYGPGCNTIFPQPTCPNTTPPATASEAPETTSSP